MTGVGDPDSLAVYVHWPFCVSKCPYCDFNSHVRERIDEAQWQVAYAAAIDAAAARTPGRRVTSIFFGGGTPSLMAPATVAGILDRIALGWTVDRDVEVTIEANPGSVEAGRFAGYRAAGVGRVSLGVQALDDEALHQLGRRHDAGEALRALALAARIFPRWSFDLIYARPGHTVAAWQAELARALPLAGDHLSVYQLTIEAGTRFATLHERGELVLPDEEVQGALYEATQQTLADAGLPAYEISNHARPGGESRHNLAYWRYGDYAGIGPGAHGRLTLGGVKIATRQKKAPESWLAAVAATGDGVEDEVPVDQGERLSELLMMGLRLAEGVPLSRVEAETGRSLAGWIRPDRIERLVRGGFLACDGDRLAATDSGRQRLNAVLSALLPAAAA
ncbi:oxygen-independent coproporphyrinogen-3 oxidase [Stella humosa]|uniref:Heme chaperone HemW n=1 Tax=Stella humosa TaxID=94 RepID=A0A3N1LJ40_9PROT|nr:radical SAM family heme chaperone HemW [Stella humosa]ROP90868.1 oxygen-independent coproporphyrinogen-3 oxidase [Stella humosa]BBK34783.1 coproporphyrinogen III oxidase [Stella humosa]